MEKNKFLDTKTDEFLCRMMHWGEIANHSPFSMALEIKTFLETVYEEGATSQRVFISGKDIRTIINKDDKWREQNLQ